VTSISYETWSEREEAHYQKAVAYTQPYRERKCRHEAHPIDDFLFTYYNFSLAKVERWQPSFREILALPEGESLEAFFKDRARFARAPFGVEQFGSAQALRMQPHQMTDKQRAFMRWIADLLEQTFNRTPNFGCFGMHEWAMVYEGQEVRHEKSTSLRLPQEEIDTFVRSRPLCCSHFDAFRFFAPNAVPMNRFQPNLDTRPEHEQPACLHANMDLYKWAFKAMPWVGSEILWECFELALQGRELDMKASPYDLSSWGRRPIKVETPEGRVEYEAQQRQLSEKSQLLRKKLLGEIQALIEWAG